MGQNTSTKRRFHFHPSTSPDDDFLKRRFSRNEVLRFAPAILKPRRAQRIYTHLPTHPHPHAHLTAIPAFPDAGG